MVGGQREGGITALIGKMAGKCVIMLAAGILLGTLLLTLVYMLPVNTENRDVSYSILDEEGWYPRTYTVSSGDEYFLSFYPDVLDNSSDKIMLTIAMDSSAGNPLVRAMESYSEYAGSYSYYWHGYVAILRPLLFFFDFSEIRILNSACQMFIIILLGWLIGREKGVRYVLALITSYILLHPRTVSMGLQYSWIFYIAYGGTLLLLWKRRFFAEKQRAICFFYGIRDAYQLSGSADLSAAYMGHSDSLVDRDGQAGPKSGGVDKRGCAVGVCMDRRIWRYVGGKMGCGNDRIEKEYYQGGDRGGLSALRCGGDRDG